MAEFSEEWEGRTIDGVFPLRQFLGGGENGAAFLTTYETRSAAIKLLSIDPANADAQLSRWREAEKLSHPNLVKIFAMGRCVVDEMELLYIVTEHAEENLSQVLPDRSLTAAETREMLPPTLSALAYIHEKGLVHAHLKPANIMAVDECLKISSDGIRKPGHIEDAGPYDPPEKEFSAAGDVWSLGMTLAEILTQHIPSGGTAPRDLPEPFAEIVNGCMVRTPADRWSISQVSKQLTGSQAGAPAPRKKRKLAPVGVLILLGLLVVTVVGVMIRRSETETPAAAAPIPTVATTTPQPAPPPPAPVVESKKQKAQEADRKKEPEPEPEAKIPAAKSEPANEAPATSGILSQPLPEIIDQARNSIHGRVRVTLRVDVDPSGNVTDAKLDSPGTNKYFGDRAIGAVRQWKFEPVKVNGSDVGQRWRVRLEFYKTGTKVQPQRVSP